jgi:hypothetical protein
MKSWLSVHNQKASLPSTSGTGPRMHSSLLLPTARLRRPNQRRSRHSRLHIGRLCIPRSRGNHRNLGSHRIHGSHRIRGSHRILGLTPRR